MADIRRLYVKVHSKKGSPPVKPLRVPRPGDAEKKKKKPVTGAALVEALRSKGVQIRYTPATTNEEGSKSE